MTLSCVINQCTRLVRPGRRLCEAHAQRLTRYGSPTARMCHKCRAVVDNEASSLIGSSGRWLCDACLVGPIRFRKRDNRYQFYCRLDLEHVKWIASRCVALQVQTSEFMRSIIDRVMKA